jgi:hypothetical protein
MIWTRQPMRPPQHLDHSSHGTTRNRSPNEALAQYYVQLPSGSVVVLTGSLVRSRCRQPVTKEVARLGARRRRLGAARASAQQVQLQRNDDRDVDVLLGCELCCWFLPLQPGGRIDCWQAGNQATKQSGNFPLRDCDAGHWMLGWFRLVHTLARYKYLEQVPSLAD